MNTTTFTPESVIFGYDSPETARVVDDYPYGRRLRTQIRYWIQTDGKHGDRFVSQTVNPATGRWNKPKCSTYSPVMAMYVNDKGHVVYASLSTWAEEEWFTYFMSVVTGHLNPLQLRQVARIIGLNKAFEGVTFTVREGAPTNNDLQRATARLRHAVAVETAAALKDLGA